MDNRIPIDELFRKHLSEGKEPHNLGAWANMERMLDGKNPYADDAEPRKKRRLLPLIGLIVALTGILSAGYLAKKANPTKSDQSYASHVKPLHEADSNQNTIESSGLVVNDNSISSNKVSEPSEIESDNSKNIQNLPSSNHSKNSDFASTSTTDNLPKKVQQNDFNSESQINETPQKINKHHKIKASKSSVSNKLSSVDLAKGDKTESQSNNSSVPNGTSDVSNSKIDTHVKVDSIQRVKITQTIQKDRQGVIKKIVSDSVPLPSMAKQKIETSTLETQNTPENLAEAKPEVVNPRYVQLSPEEEIAANESVTLASASMQIESPTLIESKKDLTLDNKPISTHETNQVKIRDSKNSQSKSFFQDMVNATKANYEKIKNSKFNPFSGMIETYPGITAGVNSSLINSKNNFGGFQIGLTDLIPINDYFSILTELKGFWRNNSGYTINDMQTKVFEKNTDITSLASQNEVIYTYQTETSTRKHNFKSFASLELPIMLQRNFKNFGVYGGVNLAYNFRLNTTSQSASTPAKRDTIILSKFETFNFPSDNSYEYVRDDFKSRLGMGYAFGCSYSFNPQIYVDLRVTQSLWNTGNSASSKLISKGVFQEPSFQFSLAYRFRKYSPESR
jgi:hypothetical protein